MGVFERLEEDRFCGVPAGIAGRARVPVEEGGPFGRAHGLHADHGPEHVRRAGKVAEHPRRMVHFWGGLQGHLVVRDIRHEAFRVAEVEVPGVEQGASHGRNSEAGELPSIR